MLLKTASLFNMATTSVELCFSYKILNPFQVFISKIAQELIISEVKIFKSLITDRLPRKELDKVDTNQEGSGVELISLLQRYRHISQNNLGLLKELLGALSSKKLLEKVEEFEKKITELDDATKAQMDAIDADVSTLVDLFLVLTCKKESLSDSHIDLLKKRIKDVTGLKLSDILYLCSKENRDENVTVVKFKFHESKDSRKELLNVSEKLNSSAIKKEPWLTENKIVSLKVNGDSSINIVEKVNFETEAVEDESFVAMKPELQFHQTNVVDVILLVEMGHSVKPHLCVKLLDECQSAIKELSESTLAGEGLDMNLAVIQFGDHSTSDAASSAVVIQDFSKDFFGVKDKLKDWGKCGARKGNSGVADGLAKVVELARNGSMRTEASKVCVMISFVSNNEDLRHYEGTPDNDMFKMARTMSEDEITLYAFGINGSKVAAQTARTTCIEEDLLSGVAHVGGGRYFSILKDDMSCINKIFSAIVKHEVLIENHGEATGEAFKDALNSHFGDTNVIQLAKDMDRDSRYQPLKSIEKLQQNGRLLRPVCRMVERLSLSDDLDDAIGAIQRSIEREKEPSSSQSRCAAPAQVDAHKRLVQIGPIEPTDLYAVNILKQVKATDQVEVAKVPDDAPENLTLKEINHLADLEMASRVVRRHMHRMAYYKKKNKP